MNFPAKTIFAATLAIAGLGVTVETSSAMTPARAAATGAPLVQDVRWGCGPGWHPTPWGRCVPERRPAYFDGYRPHSYGDGYRPHSYGDGYRPNSYGDGYRPRYWSAPVGQPDGWHRY